MCAEGRGWSGYGVKGQRFNHGGTEDSFLDPTVREGRPQAGTDVGVAD